MKDSFVFYKSWQDALNLLPDAESLKKVFNAICDFVFLKKEVEETDFTAHELTIIKMGLPLLAASIANYENGMKGAKFGKLGGRPRKNQNPLENPLETPNDNDNEKDTVNLNEKVKDTVNLNVKDTVNVKDKENLKNNNNHNNIPSFSEIDDFAKENGLKLVDTQEFYRYYNEHGWELVYNWKKLLVKWNENQQEWKQKELSSDPYAALR